MLKRAFDIVCSLLGLILLSPLLILLSLIIKLRDNGPIFYQATRAGQAGQPFKLYKFRSMVLNADKMGPAVTGANDNRITPIGKILRKSKLDELPQLLNVLKGDMSIVGPRPEDLKYVAFYNPEQRRILTVRPGITSPASIEYRDEETLLTGNDWEKYYIEKVMPAKLAIDLDYVSKANVLQDVKIILKTLVRVIS